MTIATAKKPAVLTVLTCPFNAPSTGRRAPAAPPTRFAGGTASGSMELSVTPYSHHVTL